MDRAIFYSGAFKSTPEFNDETCKRVLEHLRIEEGWLVAKTLGGWPFTWNQLAQDRQVVAIILVDIDESETEEILSQTAPVGINVYELSHGNLFWFRDHQIPRIPIMEVFAMLQVV